MSFVIPSAGQILAGGGIRGTVILTIATVIANLSFNILRLIAIADPAGPASTDTPSSIWAYWIP
jgi:hypothetical protein